MRLSPRVACHSACFLLERKKSAKHPTTHPSASVKQNESMNDVSGSSCVWFELNQWTHQALKCRSRNDESKPTGFDPTATHPNHLHTAIFIETHFINAKRQRQTPTIHPQFRNKEPANIALTFRKQINIISFPSQNLSRARPLSVTIPPERFVYQQSLIVTVVVFGNGNFDRKFPDHRKSTANIVENGIQLADGRKCRVGRASQRKIVE